VQQHHGTDGTFDAELLPEIQRVLQTQQFVVLSRSVTNIDRSIGTRISGFLAGLPERRHVTLTLAGTAGQSFGAWGFSGLTIQLTGTTNDYAGKGLSGAELIVRPYENPGYDPTQSVITGNVALYGATSGEAFFAGVAGERFAVRNSGATAVVEGVGDHGCEYMTGGTVVVIGPVGRNFAAGMSGGFAYVWAPARDLRTRLNNEMVTLQQLTPSDHDRLASLLRRHAEKTESRRAADLLQQWPARAEEFVKVVPNDYAHAMDALSAPHEVDVHG
jgi:glutamate synthase (NADPH/NADH) large chain